MFLCSTASLSERNEEMKAYSEGNLFLMFPVLPFGTKVHVGTVSVYYILLLRL